MATSSTNLSLTLQTGSEGKGNRLTILNANWNVIDALFHATTGHAHDGSSGEGPKITVTNLDPTGSTDGQVATSTGSGTSPAWENAPGTALTVRNESGGTLAIGTLVYASSWDEDETAWLISKADADVAGAEALFVLAAAINNNANGTAYRSHRLTSQNTSAGSVGDPVYLSTTAGGWTLTAPTATDSVQIVVGRVAVDHASNGVVEVNIDAGQTLKIGSNQLQSGAAGSGLSYFDVAFAASL